jgi:hypothetical protein
MVKNPGLRSIAVGDKRGITMPALNVFFQEKTTRNTPNPPAVFYLIQPLLFQYQQNI